MKKSIKTFVSSFYLTLTVIFCILFAFFGTAKAYERMVYISFGEKKTAIEINESGIRILDFMFYY